MASAPAALSLNCWSTALSASLSTEGMGDVLLLKMVNGFIFYVEWSVQHKFEVFMPSVQDLDLSMKKVVPSQLGVGKTQQNWGSKAL